LDQGLKTRLVADAVVDLVNLKIPASAILLLIRFFQPIQNFSLVAKSKIDRRERCRTDVSVFREIFEFMQGLIGFRAVSGNSVSVAEESLIPSARIGRSCFLKFRDCAGRVALLKEREA